MKRWPCTSLNYVHLGSDCWGTDHVTLTFFLLSFKSLNSFIKCILLVGVVSLSLSAPLFYLLFLFMTSQLQMSVSAAYIEESYCLCFLSNVAGVDLPIKSALKLSLLTVSWHYVNKKWSDEINQTLPKCETTASKVSAELNCDIVTHLSGDSTISGRRSFYKEKRVATYLEKNWQINIK